MKVALFSDVHGRLRIMLRMLQCWQIEHGEFLDGALMAGDIGCFPDESRFDKATRRWIERDPEEAGFPRYFMRPKNEIKAVFNGIPELGVFSAVRCNIFFVPGNHEDYEYLNDCQKNGTAGSNPVGTFTVDCYKRILCMRNGTIVKLRGSDGALLRVGGLWGIENTRECSPGKISVKAAQSLIKLGHNSFDLLLTHDVPHHSYTGYSGSPAVSRVLEACKPHLHLFGHAHPVNGRYEFRADPVPTASWIFEDVGFGSKCNGNLNGSMGILHMEKDGGKTSLRVEIVKDAWLAEMRHSSWKYVWPRL